MSTPHSTNTRATLKRCVGNTFVFWIVFLYRRRLCWNLRLKSRGIPCTPASRLLWFAVVHCVVLHESFRMLFSPAMRVWDGACITGNDYLVRAVTGSDYSRTNEYNIVQLQLYGLAFIERACYIANLASATKNSYPVIGCLQFSVCANSTCR